MLQLLVNTLAVQYITNDYLSNNQHIIKFIIAPHRNWYGGNIIWNQLYSLFAYLAMSSGLDQTICVFHVFNRIPELELDIPTPKLKPNSRAYTPRNKAHLRWMKYSSLNEILATRENVIMQERTQSSMYTLLHINVCKLIEPTHSYELHFFCKFQMVPLNWETIMVE